MIAMLVCEVAICESLDWIFRLLANCFHPGLSHFRDSQAARLSDQVLLRFEVAVEATVGQARTLHQVGNADPIDAAFSKQPGRQLEDAFSVFCCLLAAYFHDRNPPGLPDLPGNWPIYMMIIIHNGCSEGLRNLRRPNCVFLKRSG